MIRSDRPKECKVVGLEKKEKLTSKRGVAQAGQENAPLS